MARQADSMLRRPRYVRRLARGQALVEFAMIFPILLTVIFGIIEFALILSSLGGFNFAARDGARLGSLLGRSDPNTDQEIVSLISGHVLGLVMAKAKEVDIYRAAAGGSCLNQPLGSGAASVSVDDPSCIKNRYNLDGSVYAGSSILWPVNDRDDSLASADYLGVRIKFQYNWLTAFVAGSAPPLQLSATSVQRIEPLDFTGRVSPSAPILSTLSTFTTLSTLAGLRPPHLANWLRASPSALLGARWRGGQGAGI